ncbi:unnamed protein product [Orchesella dallaii]|uniref:Odorant receptor n=1 Tax=Orchesella dallaii TaxID=48710 RepID=A0ABP1QKK9_9HEXA
MFSDRFYILVTLGSAVLQFFGAIPYRWDYHKRCYSICDISSKLLKFNYTLVVIWQIFFVIQTVRFKRDGDMDSFNILYAFTIATFLPLVTLSLYVNFPKDIKAALHGFLTFSDYIVDSYQPFYDRNKSLRGILIDIFVLVIAGGIGLTQGMVCLTMILFPRAPVFFTNVLCATQCNSIQIAAISFFQFYVTCIIYWNVGFTVMMLFLYGIVVFSMLIDEFCLNLRKYRTIDTFRNLDDLMFNYRCFQILQSCSMEVFGYILVPIQSTIMNLVVFCNFMMLIHGSELQIITLATMSLWSILCTSSWTFILFLGGYMHKSSERTFRSWKVHPWGSKNERKIMSKFRKSCRPVLIQFGNMYVIRKRTCLKFLRGITKGTFRALLALGRNL